MKTLRGNILVIASVALCLRGWTAEVDVQVSSSPQTFVVHNDGEAARPTLYVYGQTDTATQPPKHLVGPALNAVRLCERMLSQGVLILRPDGIGTFGYRAGFELFPEPITAWPEHEVFYGKWKFDPVRPAAVTRTSGNFLQIALNDRPASTLYELSFPEAIRMRSVTVQANCDYKQEGYRAITRVWADAGRRQLLGETATKDDPSARHYPQTVESLDTSRAFVEITSNGQSRWSGLYYVTLSAELDTKAIKLPTLAPGKNEFTYTDDANSSHRCRVIFRWGKPERRPQPPIPERLLNYRSPFADAPPKTGKIVKLNEFFPMGMYEGVSNYPANVVAWLMDDQLAHGCNVWHVNNLNMARLDELIPLAEQRGMRILAQGGGWPSLYYVPRGTPEERKRLYERVLAPAARKIVPPWQGRWGLLAWSLVEEIHTEHVREIVPYYALMRELDPTHESLVLHNDRAACAEDTALNRNPVAFHDTYPFFTDCRNGPCTTARSLAYYKKRLETFAGIAKQHGLPMWVMMQAYGEPPRFDPDPPHFGYGDGRPVPTAAQLRVQVWLALAYGAKGLWWYPNRTTHAESIAPITADWNPTPIWDEIGKLHAAVARIADLLLKLEPAPDTQLAQVSGDSLFVAWHRTRQGTTVGRYLIVVNENLQEGRQASMTARDGQTLWEMTSGKPIEAKSRTLHPGEGAVFFVGPSHQDPLAAER